MEPEQKISVHSAYSDVSVNIPMFMLYITLFSGHPGHTYGVVFKIGCDISVPYQTVHRSVSLIDERLDHEATLTGGPGVWRFVLSVLVGTIVHLCRDHFESPKFFRMESFCCPYF